MYICIYTHIYIYIYMYVYIYIYIYIYEHTTFAPDLGNTPQSAVQDVALARSRVARGAAPEGALARHGGPTQNPKP